MEGYITFDFSRIKTLILLGFLLVIFGFELSVTMNSPIAFGDEGYHVATARAIATRLEYPIIHPLFVGTDLQEVTYSRLPLWNVIEGSFYLILGFSPLIIKFLMPFVAFLIGLSTFLLVKRIYSEDVAFIAAVLVVTIPSFVTYSVLFYTVVPMVLFLTISFFSFLLAIKTNKRKYWLMTSVFGALAILANLAGAAIFFVYFLYGLYDLFKNRNFFDMVKKYGMVVLIILALMTPWVLRNINYYYVPGCSNIQLIVQGSCVQEQTYSSDFEFAGRTGSGGTEVSVLSLGIMNYLQFAYGFVDGNYYLNLIGITLIPFTFLAGLFIIIKRRDKLDIAIIFAVLVYFLVFYQTGGLSFEGRSEDLARYFLNAIPVIALLSGIYLSRIMEFLNKYNKYAMFIVIIAIMGLSYLSFNQKLTTMSGVKRFSPLFFEGCEWIDENLERDATLLSLHTYPTIFNCNRQADWSTPLATDIILSNDLELSKSGLEQNGIEYIFVQKFSLSQTPFLQSVPTSFVSFLESNPDSFQKIYENGPDINICISQGGCDGTVVYKVL